MAYDLLSPGGEAVDAISKVLAEREKTRQQQIQMAHTMLQDQLANEREARQERQGQMDIQLRQQQQAGQQYDRLRTDTENRAKGMAAGDYLADPEDIKNFQQFMPDRVEVNEPGAVGPVLPGQAPLNTVLRYKGSAAQQDQAESEAEAKALFEEMKTDDGRQNLQLNPLLTFARFKKAKMSVPPSILTATGQVPPEPMLQPPMDPTTNNKYNRVTGLTPNTMWHFGILQAVTGKPPNMGLGGRDQVVAARTAVMAQAAALVDAAHTDLPTLQREWGAWGKALDKIVPDYTAASAAANTANDFLQLAADQAQKVPRTEHPVENRFLQWWQSGDKAITGNPDLSQLELYIYAAGREYNKVVSGTVGSVQAPTDATQAFVSKLLSAAQTPETFASVAQGMQNDMDTVRRNKLAVVRQTSDVIANFLGTVTHPIGSPGYVAGSTIPTDKPAAPVPTPPTVPGSPEFVGPVAPGTPPPPPALPPPAPNPLLVAPPKHETDTKKKKIDVDAILKGIRGK